jgi:hypothetical protein
MNPAHVRYYDEFPKTTEQCVSHALDHAAVGWSRQIDPRWTEEQQQAYVEAYERAKHESSRNS